MQSPETEQFLCDGCPAKGDGRVDTDAGALFYIYIDSFRQARMYRLQYPDDYSSNEELVRLSSNCLRYFDPEEEIETGDGWYEIGGDEGCSVLGVACAERVLRGNCPKPEEQVIKESEIT